MRTKSRNPWLLVLLLAVGTIVGSLLGDLFKDSFQLLSYSTGIGLAPSTLDLKVVQLTFGLTIQLNLASVLGIVLAILAFFRL